MLVSLKKYQLLPKETNREAEIRRSSLDHGHTEQANLALKSVNWNAPDHRISGWKGPSAQTELKVKFLLPRGE